MSGGVFFFFSFRGRLNLLSTLFSPGHPLGRGSSQLAAHHAAHGVADDVDGVVPADVVLCVVKEGGKGVVERRDWDATRPRGRGLESVGLASLQPCPHVPNLGRRPARHHDTAVGVCTGPERRRAGAGAGAAARRPQVRCWARPLTTSQAALRPLCASRHLLHPPTLALTSTASTSPAMMAVEYAPRGRGDPERPHPRLSSVSTRTGGGPAPPSARRSMSSTWWHHMLAVAPRPATKTMQGRVSRGGGDPRPSVRVPGSPCSS